MKSHLVLVAVAAGALSAGVVLGQARSQIVQINALSNADPSTLGAIAKELVLDWDEQRQLATTSAQASQVANEATVRLLYVIARQQSELIRIARAR